MKKNTHTNVWQNQAYKHAYKCMTKTRIQMYGKNTHTNVWQKHAHKCMTKIYSYTGLPIPAPRGHGVPCSSANAVARRWIANCPAVSPPFLYLSSECALNRQPSSYWTTTLTTEPWLPQIQTYTCMRKTRTQMYEKNRHTNVWQKHAYKCMTRRWTATPPAISPLILFLSGEWGLNCQLFGYWTTTLTTAPRPTQIQT